MTNAELIVKLRILQGAILNPHHRGGEYVDKRFADVCVAAADALEAANKTVIPHRNYERCHIYWCDCGWFLQNKDKTPNYCPNCGKRIEWESAE